MMQWVALEKQWKIFCTGDHVLPSGNYLPSRLEHTGEFKTQLAQIACVVEHLTAVHQCERSRFERKTFTPILDYRDRNARFRGKPPDCPGTDLIAAVRLERSRIPSVFCQGICGDAAAGADIQRPPAGWANEFADRLPFGTRDIAFCNLTHPVIVEP